MLTRLHANRKHVSWYLISKHLTSGTLNVIIEENWRKIVYVNRILVLNT